MNQPANAHRQIDRAEKLSVKGEGSGKLQVILERDGNRNRRRGSTATTNGVADIGHSTAKRWQSKGNGHALTQRHELALRKTRHPGTSTPLKVCKSEQILRCREANLEQTKKREVAANVRKQLPHGALTQVGHATRSRVMRPSTAIFTAQSKFL